MNNPDDIVVRRTYKSNLLDEIKFYEVDCNWKGLLTEARTCYGYWKSYIEPKASETMHGGGDVWDMSMSKNAYSIITLSSTMPNFFDLWQQTFKNIRSHPGLETKPLWIHAWMNVHRFEDLGEMSMGWHNHYYVKYHGFLHLSDKPTTTVFSNVVPKDNKETDKYTEWYYKTDNRSEHPLDQEEEAVIIPNKQGLQYLGPGPIMHKVRAEPFDGFRVSIGYDVIEDLNWTPMPSCTSELGVCQSYPVFDRRDDFFNTKLVPIPVL
jgi:hypothetical protein